MLLSLLIAIGLSMDSFAVSLACASARKGKILFSAALVAASFAFFQAGMAGIGFVLGASFLPPISSFDHWIAFLLLLFIGGGMVLESGNTKECSEKHLTPKRLVFLSLATSMDALAVGVSFAFLPLDAALTLLLIGAITFIISFCGAYFGSRLKGALGKEAELVGGSILIGIGARILIDHMGWAFL